MEPFCGSAVVALNLRPPRALLCDANPHIIRLYRDIQSGRVTATDVRAFLSEEGAALESRGEAHYYAVRERFNAAPGSLDFLFLNRSCFNGVMRFNRKGGFNVPFCRKPNRFAPAYITKIANQVGAAARVIAAGDWDFEVADFRATLARVKSGDFVYADPPYAGRHVDYFNSWFEDDERDLAARLRELPCAFALSTWHGNRYRRNPAIDEVWSAPGFHVLTREHFYHVGSTESLRHAMTEALVTNFVPNGETKSPPVFEFAPDL